jgi:hypothetical protein
LHERYDKYTFLAGKPEGKSTLERPRNRRNGNSTMALTGIGCGLDETHSAGGLEAVLVKKVILFEDGCLLGCSAVQSVRRLPTFQSQTARRYNPEDGHIRTYRRENLKSYKILFGFHRERGILLAS